MDVDQAYRMKDEVIKMAQMKLTRRHDIGDSVDSLSEDAYTAILDVRLMFDYEPGHQAAQDTQANLVASHMRIAYSVPKSREYIRSGYSSEPILAEAAAQLMRKFRLEGKPFWISCAEVYDWVTLRITLESFMQTSDDTHLDFITGNIAEELRSHEEKSKKDQIAPSSSQMSQASSSQPSQVITEDPPEWADWENGILGDQSVNLIIPVQPPL